MLLLGHFGLGILSGITARVFLKRDFNPILICLVSVLPDIDFLIPFIQHRGPTHSVIVATLFFIPIIILYKNGVAYYLSILTHSLIGDYFTAYGCMILYPLNNTFYRVSRPYLLRSKTQFTVEVALFLTSIILYFILNRKQKG